MMRVILMPRRWHGDRFFKVKHPETCSPGRWLGPPSPRCRSASVISTSPVPDPPFRCPPDITHPALLSCATLGTTGSEVGHGVNDAAWGRGSPAASRKSFRRNDCQQSEHTYLVAEMAMARSSIWTRHFVQINSRLVEWSISQFPNRADRTALIVTDWQFRCHGIGPAARRVGL